MREGMNERTNVRTNVRTNEQTYTTTKHITTLLLRSRVKSNRLDTVCWRDKLEIECVWHGGEPPETGWYERKLGGGMPSSGPFATFLLIILITKSLHNVAANKDFFFYASIKSLSLGAPFRYGFLILVALSLNSLCFTMHAQHYPKRKWCEGGRNEWRAYAYQIWLITS